MKNLVLFPLLALTSLVFAQSDTYFQIHHMLGDDEFSFASTGVNNLGEEFETDRMEYYLSEITLIHDGGMETPVSDTWILANAAEVTNVYLGSFDITDLEAVRFGIGVDPDNNHLDPASWPSDHPLYPQLPSMHWGWAAGYRFVAFEGYAGAGFSQNYQIHALGDVNYRTTEIATTGTMIDGALYIALEGDYQEALRDVSVEGGLINHGETDEAADVLLNFADHVFREGTATVITTSVNEPLLKVDMVISPNPAGEFVQVNLAGSAFTGSDLVITDMHGQQLMILPAQESMIIDIDGLAPGVYLVSVRNEKVSTAARQLIVH